MPNIMYQKYLLAITKDMNALCRYYVLGSKCNFFMPFIASQERLPVRHKMISRPIVSYPPSAACMQIHTILTLISSLCVNHSKTDTTVLQEEHFHGHLYS